MTRYIDADTLYVKVKAECNPYGKPTISFDDGCKVLDMIRRIPTADVAPVVHAHWVSVDYHEISNATHECSNCHADREFTTYEDVENNWKYCGHCGAKMDEKQ